MVDLSSSAIGFIVLALAIFCNLNWVVELAVSTSGNFAPEKMASSLSYEIHHYGKDHELQKVGVWKTASEHQETGAPWVV